MLFGPFSRNRLKGQVNVGIIGPERQRGYIKEYLQTIHRPVFPENPDKARPSFPGIEAAFGVCINFDNLIEIDVPAAEIDKCLKYTDGHIQIGREHV